MPANHSQETDRVSMRANYKLMRDTEKREEGKKK